MTKIKKLLVSFGYKKIDKFIYVKPMGFISMVAKIEDEKLTLSSNFFKKHDDNVLVTWNSKDLMNSEIDEMEFEELSRTFASIENEVYHIVYNGKPMNIITAPEIMMIEQGVL
jgi:hypothetical protein